MPRRIEPGQFELYTALRRNGYSKARAAKESGVSRTTADKWDAGLGASVASVKKGLEHRIQPKPIPIPDLCPEAKRALVDFRYFRRRYFGRISTPWQEEAAYRVLAFVESPRKEFVVVNCPPGSGKSTLFTHDIPAWLTARRRHIRGLIISATQTLADSYTLRLRETFETDMPIQAYTDEAEAGLAVDAEATLRGDYGAFRPSHGVWAVGRFTVSQYDGMRMSEKEATWQSYGLDSEFIGSRINFAVADDSVSDKSLLSVDQIDKDRRRWDRVVQRRIEPRGTLVLQGQRLGPEDLYRYALDKKAGSSQDIDHETGGTAWVPLLGLWGAFPAKCCDAGPGRQYHHIVYRAHDDAHCLDLHDEDAPYQGQGGCLLDPRRLGWHELENEMENDLSSYLCTPGDTPILMADWTNKPIAEVREGDWVMGFESRPTACGLRDFRVVTQVSAVQAVGVRPVVEITLENGHRMRSTPDHPWYRRLGKGKGYAPAAVRDRLTVYASPVYVDPSELADWSYLAGIMDGEGHIPTSHAGRPVTIAQSKSANPDVFASIQSVLDRLGVAYTLYEPLYGRQAHLFQIRETRQFLRRLLTAVPWMGKAHQARAWLAHGGASLNGTRARVERIEPVADEMVYGLTTGTANYFAWGVPCHNTVFQQEDADPQKLLIQQLWIDGGVDPATRIEYMGCKDKDRSAYEMPGGLVKPWFSIVTADPSPANFWGIQWWVYVPASEERFLVACLRKVMGANDFLERVWPSGGYIGLLEEWRLLSHRIGYPISHLIFEKNAAQRWAYRYEFFKDWLRKYGVTLLPHDTQRNKSDEKMGVTSLRHVYRHGRARLPYKGDGMLHTLRLTEELTKYPMGRYDDEVMANWFLEFNLPGITIVEETELEQERPTWMLEEVTA